MSSQIIINERVDSIIDLFNRGYGTYGDVYTYAAEKGWGVTERQVQNYIKKALKKMTDLAIMKQGNVKHYALSNLMFLQQETLKREEFNAAFQIVKEIAKISGAYDPIKEEEIEDKIIIPHTSTKEELRKRIENEDF